MFSDAIKLEALLNRTQAATALTDAGYPTSAATLATLASRGGGPDYERFGVHALYRWGQTLDWAKNRSRKRTATRKGDLLLRTEVNA
jgi:hypothetical protein